MPIITAQGSILVYQLSISLEAFPRLLARHGDVVEGTLSLESEAREVAECDFPEDASVAFVKHVCRWGGYSGVWGRVLRDNAPLSITSALREAHTLARQGRPVDGLSAVLALKNLGVSFASKHLRFLAPDRAVVLDSVIGRLGYALDVQGYRQFLADCTEIQTVLNQFGVENPLRPQGAWLPCDVEMAIFAELMNFKDVHPKHC